MHVLSIRTLDRNSQEPQFKPCQVKGRCLDSCNQKHEWPSQSNSQSLSMGTDLMGDAQGSVSTYFIQFWSPYIQNLSPPVMLDLMAPGLCVRLAVVLRRDLRTQKATFQVAMETLWSLERADLSNAGMCQWLNLIRIWWRISQYKRRKTVSKSRRWVCFLRVLFHCLQWPCSNVRENPILQGPPSFPSLIPQKLKQAHVCCKINVFFQFIYTTCSLFSFKTMFFPHCYYRISSWEMSCVRLTMIKKSCKTDKFE